MKIDELVIALQTNFDKAINSISGMINRTEQLSNKTSKLNETLSNVNKTIEQSSSKKVDFGKNFDITTFKNKLKKLEDEKKIIDKILYSTDVIHKGQAPGELLIDGNWYSAMENDIKLVRDRQKEVNQEIDNTKQKIRELNNLERERKYAKKDPSELSSGNKAKKEVDSYKQLTKMVNQLSSSFNSLRKASSSFGTMFKKTTTAMQKGLDNTFGRLQKMALGLIGVRTAMSVLTKSVGAYLSFDSALQDSLTNSWNMLGSLLAPAIEFVANAFATATNYVYQFVQALTGIDLVARANAKALETQAKKAKEAQKAQRGLLGMDEITNLPTESELSPASQITVGGISGNGIFGELFDALRGNQWHIAGELVGKGIEDMLNSINWDKIKSSSMHLGTNIADFLRGLFEVDWVLIGESIGNGIQTALNFAYGFVETFSFIELGGGLGRALKNAIRQIDWGMLAITLSDGFIGIFKGITSFFNELDAGEMTNNIATFLKNIKWKELAQSFFEMVKTAFGTIDEVLSGILGEGTTALILGILVALEGISVILPIITFAMNPMSLLIAGIVLLIKHWETVKKVIIDVAKGIWDTIVAVLDAIWLAIDNFIIMITEPFKNLFIMISTPFIQVYDLVSGIIKGIIKMLKGDFVGGAKEVGKGFANAFITGLNGLIAGVNSIIMPFRAIIAGFGNIMGMNWSLDDVKIPKIPKLATGTNEIITEGIYHLHEGEAVVPKKYNPAVSGYDNNQDNKQMIDLLISLNTNLIEYAQRPININMDSRKVAEATYSDMENIRANKNTSTVVVRS